MSYFSLWCFIEFMLASPTPKRAANIARKVICIIGLNFEAVFMATRGEARIRAKKGGRGSEKKRVFSTGIDAFAGAERSAGMALSIVGSGAARGPAVAGMAMNISSANAKMKRTDFFTF